jgi:hypothetical protein
MAEMNSDIFFESQEIGQNDWQLRFMSRGAELEYVTGFTSKAEAEKWRAGPECQACLKMRGYAK